MNPQLQQILKRINQAENLWDGEKKLLTRLVNEFGKSASFNGVNNDAGFNEIVNYKENAPSGDNLIATLYRQLQVEESLDRLRMQALQMIKPGDLINVCKTFYVELIALGFKQLRNAIIQTFDDEHASFLDYDYSDETGEAVSRIPYHGHPAIDSFIKQVRRSTDAFAEVIIAGEELESWKTFRKSNQEKDDPRLDNLDKLYYYFYSIGIGTIGLSTFQSISADERDILKRFRNVFKYAYKRYLDIEQAEAQAREAQIELALERVRAQAMAMHKAEDLLRVCEVMYRKLQTLGFEGIRNTMIHTFNDKNDYFLDYDFSGDVGEQISRISISGCIPMVKNYLEEIRKSTDTFLDIVVTGEELQSWKEFRKATGQLADPRIEDADTLYYYYYSIDKGDIGISTFSAVTDEQRQVLERFRNVFQLSYQRYIDIEKAEAQAREAEIQLALERVRARTMAMQKSDELSEAANLLFQQVQALGIPTWSAGYCIWDEDKTAITLSMSRPFGDIQPSFRVPLDENPTLIHYLEGYKKGLELYVEEIEGEALEEVYKYLQTLPVVGQQLNSIIAEGHPLPTYEVDHCAYFSKGFLLFITYQQVPESHEIFKRFAKVFDQTYTRFLDLQRAEAQAREAQIEGALERVRSRSIGMQKSEELKDVIQVVYEQFVHLNIHIDHAGFVVDYQPKGHWNFWIADQHAVISRITTPYYKSIWGDQFDEAKENGTNFFTTHLNFEQKNEFYEGLLSLVPGIPEEAKEFYLTCPGLAISTVLMDNVALYIENFSGTPYASYENAIIIRFGKVFQQTYTRFLDLQQKEDQSVKLKVEKERLEQTLADLRQTQAQLIQAEKMASLGELTAGIAHEIQNPLNFVNNFSDVNIELIAEIHAAGNRGDLEELKTICNDLQENEKKINHHGKRADAIVKSMLQHSRNSKGEKTPTDINALADEYLRLSYQGLRAKDPTFYAIIETDFDPRISKLNVVPQDIGRVLLNLFNNAFFAVNERKKTNTLLGYEPRIRVSTKAINAKVEIQISDNGNGIPQNIVEKIFQPFFTTKPTGQGTGLGLSLSYDIVKAHGGEIKVKTKEGEGTEFTVIVPI